MPALSGEELPDEYAQHLWAWPTTALESQPAHHRTGTSSPIIHLCKWQAGRAL